MDMINLIKKTYPNTENAHTDHLQFTGIAIVTPKMIEDINQIAIKLISVWLGKSDVFSHGQLYVCLSRIQVFFASFRWIHIVY